MKNGRALSQILIFSSICITIAVVVSTVIITNTTLRSVEKNLPGTLIKELVSLDLVLEHLSEVVAAAQLTVNAPSDPNFETLGQTVQTAFESIVTLRQSYVFDNLLQASLFHAVTAPAIADLQVWLTDGISGYGPKSPETAWIVFSRISDAFEKARALNRQSRLNAQKKFDEERDRLDRFLASVNVLFLLTLLITIIMVFLFIRQHFLKVRELKAEQTLKTQKDLLNSLFENIQIGIMVWGSKGALLFANRYFTEFSGYSVSDFSDINDWLIHTIPDPVYRTKIKKEWNPDTSLEIPISCKNNRIKTVDLNKTSLSDGRFLITLTDITARKKGEEHLRRFKTAVEFASDAIDMSDPSGRHLYRNQAFDRLFGDIGQDSQTTLFADEKIKKNVLKTIMAGGQWIGEVDMYGKDKKVLNILLRAYAIKGNDGRIVGLVKTHTDITRQKQAEKALQESEEQYRAVVENTPDLLYRTDTQGAITFISSSVERLSGFKVEEALGMKMAEEVYAFPEERQAFLEKLMAQGSVQNFEARLRHKDGSIWWASTNAHFFKGTNGRILGVEGITRDITDIKHNAEALLKSGQQMRAILEASPDPMVMYDKTGLPQFINPSFTKVFGWTLDELKGDFIPFVPEDQKERTLEKINEIYVLGQPLTFETRRYTKDNRLLDISISAAVAKSKQGEPTGLVVNLTDITERKVLEARYEHAQKMESISTLAGGIAHDFNNLLSGIFGYLDLARKKTQDPKISDYLTKAFNASERAKGLTHQLLTFSKGGAPVKKVAPLVPFLQETCQFALSGASVSCTFDIPDMLWMCDYDKNQIGQVIENIIINAHHAMPAGGNIHVTAANITLSEKNRPGLAPGRYVRISISDTGTGIHEKYLSRIFDPFFTTKQKGSGLGLATSYSIVKRHNGIIDVESKPDTGTTFNTYLPAADHAPEKESVSREKAYQGSGRILIMDDEEMIQEMLIDMLEPMGFSITSTSDGHEAVQEFNLAKKENHPFKIILLDLTVSGGMGGKETVREIRKTDADIPVFVASGYSEDAAIADPHAFGFTASIQKPFSVAQLIRMFETYINP